MRGLAASAAAEDERASKTTQKNHKPDKTEVQSTKARGAGAGREDGGQGVLSVCVVTMSVSVSVHTYTQCVRKHYLLVRRGH
jgi:hypothetical protein